MVLNAGVMKTTQLANLLVRNKVRRTRLNPWDDKL